MCQSDSAVLTPSIPTDSGGLIHNGYLSQETLLKD